MYLCIASSTCACTNEKLEERDWGLGGISRTSKNVIRCPMNFTPILQGHIRIVVQVDTHAAYRTTCTYTQIFPLKDYCKPENSMYMYTYTHRQLNIRLSTCSKSHNSAVWKTVYRLTPLTCSLPSLTFSDASTAWPWMMSSSTACNNSDNYYIHCTRDLHSNSRIGSGDLARIK